MAVTFCFASQRALGEGGRQAVSASAVCQFLPQYSMVVKGLLPEKKRPPQPEGTADDEGGQLRGARPPFVFQDSSNMPV